MYGAVIILFFIDLFSFIIFPVDLSSASLLYLPSYIIVMHASKQIQGFKKAAVMTKRRLTTRLIGEASAVSKKGVQHRLH